MKSKGVQGGRLPVASHADVFRGVLLPALKTPAWEARLSAWTSSPKSPCGSILVSDHSVFAFWVVAYERFDFINFMISFTLFCSMKKNSFEIHSFLVAKKEAK